MRRNFGEMFRSFFRHSISREKLATRNFTQIPPHIRTSNSTRLNQNSFTAILWELVGPIFPGGERQWIHTRDPVEIVVIPTEQGRFPAPDPLGKRGAKATQNGNRVLVHV